MGIEPNPFLSKHRPRRLFIQKRVQDAPLTRSIVSSLPELAPEVVEDEFAIHQMLERKVSPESYGKTCLYLAHNPNRFFKVCPGLVPDLACCNLWVLNCAVGCNLDCAYCFLQTYLPYSLVTIFVNMDDLIGELDELLQQHPEQFIRVCTGELTDSLSLDHLVGFSRRLIPEFVSRKRLSLELKTKTANIAQMEGLDPQGRVILSWTLNAESVSRREEHHTASLEDRFAAAAQAEKWGYRIGFHFDPIIHWKNWEEEYHKTVDTIFQYVAPSSIAWISLGALRFDSRLKAIVQRRFPDSRFVYGEFIPGPDGKMRYPEPLRVEMFSKMKQWIHAHSESVPVYLCMESFAVWQKAFGYAPACREEVARHLDESIIRE